MLSQLTKGNACRLMYIENKDGEIDGYRARVGWVTFSKSARTIYYRDRSFARAKGGGVRGNYFCESSGDEYWISGIKKAGSNTHWADPASVYIDEDAVAEYVRVRSS